MCDHSREQWAYSMVLSCGHHLSWNQGYWAFLKHSKESSRHCHVLQQCADCIPERDREWCRVLVMRGVCREPRMQLLEAVATKKAQKGVLPWASSVPPYTQGPREGWNRSAASSLMQWAHLMGMPEVKPPEEHSAGTV